MWLLERVPPDDRQQFLDELSAPLPWERHRDVKPTETQIEQEGAMFLAAMQSHQNITN